MDCRPDGDPQLMGAYHPGELPLGLLPHRRQRQEVPVVREYDAPEVRCLLHSLPTRTLQFLA